MGWKGIHHRRMVVIKTNVPERNQHRSVRKQDLLNFQIYIIADRPPRPKSGVYAYHRPQKLLQPDRRRRHQLVGILGPVL